MKKPHFNEMMTYVSASNTKNIQKKPVLYSFFKLDENLCRSYRM